MAAKIGYVSGDGKNIGDKVVIGIANATKTSGQTVGVIISGVSNVHSGLSTGLIYYSLENGDLTLAVTDVKIGLAISSTEILLATPYF